VPTLLEQEFIKPGPYRIAGELREYSREDLKAYKDGTIAALAAGVPIPLLEAHAPAGVEEGYPASDKDKDSAFKGRGWLRDLKQKEDGTLVQVIEVTDPEARKGIKNGSIRFTSPEFRENYTDGKGRNFGRMIRHVALTAKPRNPDQGPFAVIAAATPFGECVQFSDDDFESSDKKKPDGGAEGTPDQSKVDKSDNPDMPPSKDAAMIEEAIKGNLAELGVKLPDGLKLGMSGEAANCLLAALMTACESNRKAEEEKQAKDDKGSGNLEQDSTPGGTQFSESEKKLIAERDAAKAALARHRRESQEARILAAFNFVPPAVKDKLTARMSATQFSEEGTEQPSMTLLEVATLVKDSLPKNLQFDETKLEEAEHEDGETFFKGDEKETPETAEATARRIHSRTRTAV
jgi:hypothetical protein